MHLAYSIIVSPLGPVFAAETRQGLFSVTLGDDGLQRLLHFARRWHPDAQVVPTVIDSSTQLEEYFAGTRQGFELEFDLRGTDFQIEVWRALSAIPYGRTLTYGEIAGSLGRPRAARAVGQACGANPIPVVAPCHRVLRSEGALGGYGSGLHWKEWLLAHEKRVAG
ncbi:MAG: methylated-DNA--[protein]-cysteine S-methyltransferase [Pseudomonadota bacterium]